MLPLIILASLIGLMMLVMEIVKLVKKMKTRKAALPNSENIQLKKMCDCCKQIANEMCESSMERSRQELEI